MKTRIQVWDLPTRLFHWCLSIAVFYSWLSIEILENMQHHFYAGYSILTLLLFRLVWGFIGSRYSLFKSCIHPFSELFSYAKNLLKPSGKHYLGHNPIGGLSAILMIILLLGQALLGLFSSDDYFFGPLSGIVSSEIITTASEYHSLNSNAIYALIGIHICAIIYYKFRKKEALTSAMITGSKSVLNNHEAVSAKSNKSANSILALIVFLICVAGIYWLTTAFIDSLPTPSESYY